MKMIFMYLIIFIISIDGILTKNISKNHFIIISSCQINKTQLESIPIQTDRHYYFYFSSQSSSSLSSSSSFLPLFHLSYCEHQQTTSYSSSGFSILYSSPHFLLTDIQDKKHSLSFHHHNAVLFPIDQSSSPNTNITSIMSSSSSSSSLNENYIPTNNMMTTEFSNISLLNTTLSTIQKRNSIFNIMLLIVCIISGILVMIIIYLIIKYYNHDEGTYKIDESNHFPTKSHITNSENNGCTGIISSSNHHRQKLLKTNEQNIDDSKEWYV